MQGKQPYPFQSLIASYAKLNGLDATIVAALIERESNFDPKAIGDSGLAVGLMQLHPAACVAVNADWTKMADPEQNVRAGCAYLALMLKICSGDITWALAAYNQGPTTIARGRKYSQEIIARSSSF